jgi:hypothetical protein
MAFTGKATYSAGAALPELAEDVSDVISIVSPHETPLLDHIGDPPKAAASTVHEWLEDELLPNTDLVDDDDLQFPLGTTIFDVAHPERFMPGDQLKLRGKAEVMLVQSISGDTLTVQRQYGGSPAVTIEDGDEVLIVGGAALEGDAAPTARFGNRVRRQNYTQIFTASVEVSGSQLAAETIGVADEMDYQKQERLRELLRDLENSVINGYAPESNPEGNASTRRTMRGVIASLSTNLFTPGGDPLPPGDGDDNDLLNEALLNAALRAVWEQSSGTIDTILCGGAQKRRINGFVSSNQRYRPETSAYRQMVDVYESDYGICRVVMSRWVPRDAVLLLDSSRLSVLPLSGRNFHFKPLASTGDAELGQVIGEYTIELRNENAHAMISGLGTPIG